jgi:hypothetical protein
MQGFDVATHFAHDTEDKSPLSAQVNDDIEGNAEFDAKNDGASLGVGCILKRSSELLHSMTEDVVRVESDIKNSFHRLKDSKVRTASFFGVCIPTIQSRQKGCSHVRLEWAWVQIPNVKRYN